MSQELIEANAQTSASPFGRGVSLGGGANVGAVAIEQERAIAEAQGQLILAKRFPRDLDRANAELMKACKSLAFANAAFYSVPNRGSGPSIRFAEEVARVFGNFQYGHRELSRTEGKSEVEVFAWDMEANNRSTRQITVLHIRDAGGAQKPLKDQADIDNRIANVASKQMRGRILALMPKWLVEEAIQECRKTINGDNSEPVEVKVRKMANAFATFGVKIEHLERYLGVKIGEVLADQLVDLRGIYNSIKDGTPASDFFKEEVEPAAETPAANAIAAAAAAAGTGGAAKKSAAKPAAAKAKPDAKPDAKAETQPDPKVVDKASDPEPDATGGEESNTAENNSNSVEEPEPAVTQEVEPADKEPVVETAPTQQGDIF